MNQDIIDSPAGPNGFEAINALARGQVLQQVRSAYCTAVSVQKPREIGNVKRKLLEEARLMGEDAYYGWGAGKSAIEGPSIDLAVAAARCWGNCATDMLPVQDLPDCWVFTAAFIDLETGYTRTRQFRQAKDWTVHGKHDEERKMDMRFQIGQSKAERNVILKALPSWLINAAMEAAKEGVRQELENLTKKHGIVTIADRLMSALIKCGVKEPAILKKCSVADRKGLTVDHLVILRGDLSAIQNGQERAESLFPPIDAPPSSETAPKLKRPSPEVTAQSEQYARKVLTTETEDRVHEKAKPETLEMLDHWCKKLNLTPADKEEYCSQRGISTFGELSQEEASGLVGELAEAFAKKMQQPSAEREPGMEDE